MDFTNFFSTDKLVNTAIFAVLALLCITVHELAHGYTAYRLGDNTAKEMGRLTLNPIKHIDIVGFAMIIFVGFGWAKPVPVYMQNFKHPKWYMAVTAIAGPLSNIILAVIVIFVYMLLPSPYGGYNSLLGVLLSDSSNLVAELIFRLALLNIALAIFNLLPIPPLDGSKVLFSLLPKKYYYKLMKYERYGMILLLILLFSGRFLKVDVLSNIVVKPALMLLYSLSVFFSTHF